MAKIKAGLRIPKGWLWIAMLALTAALNGLAIYHMPIEEDVVASIERSRPKESDLFRQVQSLGLFQNRLFIKFMSAESAHDVTLALPQFGYRPVAFGPTVLAKSINLLQLLPFFTDAVQDRVLDHTRIAGLVQQLQAAIQLPGGLGLVKALEQDPLNLGAELRPLLSGDAAQNDGSWLVAERTGPLDFAQVARLYQYLRDRDQQLRFLSGDFFALENKQAVQRDIAVCSLLSLVLGGLCFYLFCRQWRVLALLLTGTLFSTAIGLLSARILDGVIYGLVLAFASTFFSFNNESLVHAAGLTRDYSRSALIGLASAIGTTLLGFLVLLFSDSHMARQMAVISIASLTGFLVFLAIFKDDVGQLSFRHVSLRRIRCKRWPTFIMGFGLLALIAVLPKPGYRTDLKSFRFSSPYLDHQVEVFTAASTRFDFSGMQAMPLSATSWADYQGWDRSGLLHRAMFHPLRLYKSEADQQSRLRALEPRLRLWLSTLQAALLDAGIRVKLPSESLTSLSLPAFLQLWTDLSPLPWILSSAGKEFMIINTDRAQRLDSAIPLHPKAFYEWILNEMATQIGRLFLIGLVLMGLYLIPWQRDSHKIVLIFLPLLAACLVLQLVFYCTERSINIVHIMGASLVIAVALDYSSILISTEHAPADQGKVVLTGGLTLSSFGSLLFATHPLLRELGLVVCIGTGVAWIFALFCCRGEDRAV